MGRSPTASSTRLVNGSARSTSADRRLAAPHGSYGGFADPVQTGVSIDADQEVARDGMPAEGAADDDIRPHGQLDRRCGQARYSHSRRTARS